MNRRFLNSKWVYPLAFATLQACTCDRIVSEQIRSPDDQRQVVVFSDLCGYNVSLNTKVAVVSSRRDSGWKGNAFIAFNGDPVGPYNAGGGPTVHARWVTNDTVVLTYHESARVKVQNLNVDGVAIRYEVDSASVTREN